jgi:nicotinate-nucleotide pyrophosphorylase (carboxylating)
MPLPKKILKSVVSKALAEDRARSDKTTGFIIPQRTAGRARIIAKEKGILCGIEAAAYSFRLLDSKIAFCALKKDGQNLRKHETVARVSGDLRAILSGERTALNFLSLLSGIATSTNAYVRKIRAKPAKILDTRKTSPALRMLEKYAVRVGGGYNHRLSLADGILVKDNHLRALRCHKKGSLDEARLHSLIRALRKKSRLSIEIEVENLREFGRVIAFGPDIVMLDNFSLNELRTAVKLRDKHFPHIKLEASGRINLKTVSRVASTGVDFISVGAVTHSPPAIDFSLEIL